MAERRDSGGLVAVTGIAAAIAPGALLGAHFGLLLFFLNPSLDLDSTVVGRGVLALALAVGIAAGAPLALVARGRPDRLLAMLPWGITIALALAAASQWVHAAHYAYYLPPGINSRLLKGAAGVSVVTLLCFYTALLHGIRRRAFGWRSRAGIAILAVLSLLLTAERRAAYPRPTAASAELGLRLRAARINLAVVAIEGITLDAVLPLAEQGQLPFLAQLLRQGASGRLTTLSPPLRVAVWTSVATGAYPYRHGVVSDRTLDAPFLHRTARLSLAPWRSGFGVWSRPLGVRAREAPPASRSLPLWRIFEDSGRAAFVVGWPAEAGAGERAGGGVPEAFFVDPDLPGVGLAVAPTTATALELRPTSRSVDPALFEPLGETAPPTAREAMVADLWRDAVARHIVRDASPAEPIALFVGLPGLLEVSARSFGGWTAVHFDGESRREQVEAAQLVSGYYGFIDRVLGRLWSSLPEPRILAIVSGHGVREPRRWRRLVSTLTPSVAIAGRIDGEADGVLMLLGDNVRSGVVLDRATLVDVAPTLLYAMGQPVPRDGDGKVQTSVFGTTFLTRNPLTFVPSYTTTPAPKEPAPKS